MWARLLQPVLSFYRNPAASWPYFPKDPLQCIITWADVSSSSRQALQSRYSLIFLLLLFLVMVTAGLWLLSQLLHLTVALVLSRLLQEVAHFILVVWVLFCHLQELANLRTWHIVENNLAGFNFQEGWFITITLNSNEGGKTQWRTHDLKRIAGSMWMRMMAEETDLWPQLEVAYVQQCTDVGWQW